MMDLPVSPFMVPIQLSSGCGGLSSVFETSGQDASDMTAPEDLSRVFCSPPRQSFQLLLRGGEDPVLKDEPNDAAPQPRRSSSRLAKVGRSSPSSLSLSMKSKAREKRGALSRGTSAKENAPTGVKGDVLTADATLLQQQETQQKKRPKRKASYLARKEEKEALAKQLDELKQQLTTLKHEAAVNNSTRAQKQTRKRNASDVLKDAIKKHQLTIAGLRAMLSEHSTLQMHDPLVTIIRLSSDRQQRDETLLRLKSHKLQEAKVFLSARSKGIDLTKRYSEEELYESPDGDLCTLRFDVFPLRYAKSVKAVFDAMLYCINNIEITISETMGYITIREDDDSSDAHISQHRLVMSISPTIQVESNSVTFSEFSDLDAGGMGCGVVASSFVDEDELYPYQPQSRVRREVTAMMMVSPHMIKRKKKRETGAALNDDGARSFIDGEDNDDVDDADEEFVVTLRRYALIKMRKTSLPIPSNTLEEIRDYYSRFSDELAKVMRANAANFGSNVL